jgi:hypothetical protein
VNIRFVKSPAPNQLEPGGSGFLELRSGHWEVKEVAVLVGRVAFPWLQDGADIVSLITFVYHFLVSDLGENEIGIGEGIFAGCAVNPGRRSVNLQLYRDFPVRRCKG